MKNEKEPISCQWYWDKGDGFGFYQVVVGNEFFIYFVDPAWNSGMWATRHLTINDGHRP